MLERDTGSNEWLPRTWYGLKAHIYPNRVGTARNESTQLRLIFVSRMITRYKDVPVSHRCAAISDFFSPAFTIK
jgi:hypothetical protein